MDKALERDIADVLDRVADIVKRLSADDEASREVVASALEASLPQRINKHVRTTHGAHFRAFTSDISTTWIGRAVGAVLLKGLQAEPSGQRHYWEVA